MCFHTFRLNSLHSWLVQSPHCRFQTQHAPSNAKEGSFCPSTNPVNEKDKIPDMPIVLTSTENTALPFGGIARGSGEGFAQEQLATILSTVTALSVALATVKSIDAFWPDTTGADAANDTRSALFRSPLARAEAVQYQNTINATITTAAYAIRGIVSVTLIITVAGCLSNA